MTRTFDTLLFDLDGTLIDSRADLASAVNHALEAVGRPRQAPQDIIPHVGNGLRVLLTDVFGEIDEKNLTTAVNAFTDFYDDHCLDETILYDGVDALLKVLAATYRLGIVTNKPNGFSEKIIKGLGVENYISAIVGGDTLTERKPHPAPVMDALVKLGSKPASALMVGDGPQDILAGRSAGMKTCLARYGYGFRPETLALKPDYIIESFSQLKEIL